jgi:hypothetical protein
LIEQKLNPETVQLVVSDGISGLPQALKKPRPMLNSSGALLTKCEESSAI